MGPLLRTVRFLLLALAAWLPFAAAAQTAPGAWSGLWWNPQESGWGIHLTQRRDIVFAALFGYSGGQPRWWTASDCRITGTTCRGTVYETRGSRFIGVTFNPATVTRTPVGEMTVAFTGAHTATLTYTINGQSRVVAIERQFVAGADPTPPEARFTDIYWRPSESGWGVTVSEQRDTMFLVLFIYDDAGLPSWYFASSCGKQLPLRESCMGRLYRATGGADLGGPFDPARVTRTEVGETYLSWEVNFQRALFKYEIGMHFREMLVERQQF